MKLNGRWIQVQQVETHRGYHMKFPKRAHFFLVQFFFSRVAIWLKHSTLASPKIFVVLVHVWCKTKFVSIYFYLLNLLFYSALNLLTIQTLLSYAKLDFIVTLYRRYVETKYYLRNFVEQVCTKLIVIFWRTTWNTHLHNKFKINDFPHTL